LLSYFDKVKLKQQHIMKYVILIFNSIGNSPINTVQQQVRTSENQLLDHFSIQHYNFNVHTISLCFVQFLFLFLFCFCRILKVIDILQMNFWHFCCTLCFSYYANLGFFRTIKILLDFWTFALNSKKKTFSHLSK